MAENFDEKNQFSIWTNYKTHLNGYFRSEDDMPGASTVVSEFRDFWTAKLDKEIDSKKTDASKEKYREIQKMV